MLLVAGVALALCALVMLETADLHERASGRAARLISLTQVLVLAIALGISLLALVCG